MHKRIKQIANGQFEYEKPVLSLSEEVLNITVCEGQDYFGEFEISCTEKKIRGIVYSTNPRMECLTSHFEGNEISVSYQFHGEGLVEGEVQRGEFLIVCNQCEYSLSFCAQIEGNYALSTNGVISDMDSFVKLAEDNYKEAYDIFCSKEFESLLSKYDNKTILLYQGLNHAGMSYQCMEEFLISVEKKKPVFIEVSTSNILLDDIVESVKETFEIKKESWGNIELHISSDADFIEIEKSTVSADDFIGSIYQTEFLVHYEKLHAGNNFASITVTSAHQVIVLDVEVRKQKKGVRKLDSNHIQIKEYKIGIMELYQAFRLKKIVTGVWANETIEILNHLHVLEPDEPLYNLMKAQAYIINRQRQEAEWLLNDFKREWMDRKAPIWGYYLYVMTLMEREPTYVDRMTKEIESIFHENPNSELLFWVLSFLQEEYYNNNARKLKAIEYWVTNGCTSPYLYLEAFYLIWQDPYLLVKLEAFEIRVLRWAVRHHAMTRDIAMQIFQVVSMETTFNPVIYPLLCAAYDACDKPENIGIICSYLIKGQCFESKYHKWFEKGIELELRITGLYEAYLQSMDERLIVSVPQIIQMYFQYESSLPYQKLAVLYNNIIAAKESSPIVFEKYKLTMSKFAMEHLQKEHIDDNLAVLYENMLDLGYVSEEIAKALSHVAFTQKLLVFDERIIRAYIYQEQLKEPQVVTIKNKVAYFQLYTNDYVIIFEDINGHRYAKSVIYEVQRLMNPQKYIFHNMQLVPNELSYILSYYQNLNDYHSLQSEDGEYLKHLLHASELSEFHIRKNTPKIIRYYHMHAQDDVINEYLKKINLAILDQKERQYMMDLMIENRLYDLAVRNIMVYGFDQVGTAALVVLGSNLIKTHAQVEPEFMLRLAEYTFKAGKYNDTVIKYLVKHYNGPTIIMHNIWKAAMGFDLNAYELEERILTQALYTDAYLPKLEQIFERYYEFGGKEEIVLAFLTHCAHSYFLNDTMTDPIIFDIIQARYQHYMDLNDACKLGLLKYLSELSERNEEQYSVADSLLAEYTCRNINFPFYKKLNKSLVLKYHLYDKVFLEYRTNPKNRVILNYSRDEDGEKFIAEDMINVYDGIFIKQFIMFFGEVIQYYITEESEETSEITESNRISNNDIYNEQDNSRYNLLNQMLISNTLQEDSSLYSHMKQYAGFDEVTKKVFKLL